MGNHGLNSKYHASIEKPVQLFYGDYNNEGKMNLLEAEFENGVLYPIRGRSCSSSAMPHLKQKFDSFSAFASASLQEIYGQERLQEAHQFQVNTLESGLLINDGDAVFSWKPLPRLAQISPVFGMCFIDGNGDGSLDLFLAQNFFGSQPETGRCDGGVSLLLRGDGGGGFDPVWPEESGLVVRGDATTATVADINEDQVPDLLTGINDGFPVVHHNRCDATYLVIRAVGTVAGAVVTAVDESGRSQVREIYSGGGYLSQSTSSLFFASPGTKFRSVTVRWPDGSESSHEINDQAGQKSFTVSRGQ
ncbi:MAG: ASPIC/UnbV domain-containing protein [Verrucomicrobia bacterium]|nr:ASPIC/UnbV domain-containing protein [Verrucomicrobiota bacterium]